MAARGDDGGEEMRRVGRKMHQAGFDGRQDWLQNSVKLVRSSSPATVDYDTPDHKVLSLVPPSLFHVNCIDSHCARLMNHITAYIEYNFQPDTQSRSNRESASSSFLTLGATLLLWPLIGTPCSSSSDASPFRGSDRPGRLWFRRCRDVSS